MGFYQAPTICAHIIELHPTGASSNAMYFITLLGLQLPIFTHSERRHPSFLRILRETGTF